jgi:hypothetical protein
MNSALDVIIMDWSSGRVHRPRFRRDRAGLVAHHRRTGERIETPIVRQDAIYRVWKPAETRTPY